MIKRLSQVARSTEMYQKPISTTVVAVIADATTPLFRQKQGNYIVLLKIIDESLNDQKLFGVMSKDCSVYLISKKKSEIDFVKGIGEIILLDKFTFSLWNDIKLEAKYQGTTQGIYVVESDKKNCKEFVVKKGLSMNFDLMIRSPELAERVIELQKWREEEMKNYFSPKLGVRILNSHCAMVEPFNMILQVTSVKSSKKQSLEQIINSKSKTPKNQLNFVIELIDSNKNQFFINFHEGNFESGNLVFLRGIKTVGQSLQIVLTSTGNILKILYNVDPTLMNYMSIHRDNQRFMVQKQDNQLTTISCENMQSTYLQQLIQLQDRYNHSNRKQDIFIKDAYLVQAIVVKYTGCLHMYHREYQILLHNQFYSELTIPEQKELKEFNRIGYIFEGNLALIDRSNQAKGIPFQISLFTSDLQGNFMAPEDFEVAEKAIGTLEQGTRRNELQRLIFKKLDKIKSETNFKNPISLIVEPIRSEKLLFRVSNTKFI